ncbi:Mov34-domain-containing protein [Gymnopus androsaceus JB14]|uniref:Mov34-domain-containing protein n=1 Tax=Gymnopus androsaceus JB14 TaxID=1447944 RepID=A0A6A4HKJ4_9AGAR|nr:Mov34-domain-containing protein [Gymnopus androsaceus JB14]
MASQQPPRRRPAMISELAALAQETSWDENGSFKYFLRLAEKYRKDAKESVARGELEDAFIAFARSASIVLEKLPGHRDYTTALNLSQRNNLSLNGKEILDNLGHLKPILLDRFDQWSAQHPDYEDSPPPPSAVESQQQEHERIMGEEARKAQEEADMARRRQQQQQQQPPPTSFAASSAVLSAKAAAGIAASRDTGPINQRQQQEEMHARSQEMMRRRQEEKLRTHSSSPSVSSYPSSGATIPNSTFSMPTPSSSLSPSTTSYHTASRASPAFQPPPVSQPNMYRSTSQQAPSILPLEHPPRFEDDSTDSERENWSKAQRYASPVRPARSPQPPPMTTMSPAPPERIEYPKLMNLHQKTQGYRPSQDSMFRYDSQRRDQYDTYQRENYHPLPQPPSQPPYIAPPPPIPPPPESSTSSAKPELSNGLKIVHLPRDCLNRFLTIAKVNTARDRETCGLLLGKDKGNRFVVTTLLVPKQHSTSDTCTMDEEELILQVTEERALITLGWIHTHPSQSCFMSSVDLHTHSAFQRMLPESFAVVCAPSSVPNFGIFRLTDPPGLGLILSCNVKEAFHPHPDAPIYTDAERGHVQMKDLNLEIVDLR